MRRTRTSKPVLPDMCAVYVRISRDREGQRLGVQRQREDTTKLAQRLGLPIFDVYEDNDMSASKGKQREHFERMLADGRAGKFGSIIAYTSSRLSREPFEKEMLIAYSRQTGVKLAYVASPTVDLDTADGRRVARITHAIDVGESETIAERARRESVQRAALGKFNGGFVPLGYRATKVLVETEKGPKVRVHVEVDPDTSALVQDAARRVLAGESLYSVAASWKRAGFKTRRGNDWRGSTVRDALTTPGVAGLRVVDDIEYTAPWPGIVPREQWEELRELLLDENRQGFKPNGYVGKRPWNGLVTCPKGHRLVTQYGVGQVLRMTCRGCLKGEIVSLKYEPLHEWLMSLVWHVVDTPEFRQRLAAQSDTTDQERRAARDELRALDQRRKRLARSFELGLRTEREVKKERDEIDRLKTEAERRLDAMGTTYVLEGVPTREVFDACDVTKQHAFLSELIDEVIVAPFPPGTYRTVARRKDESDEEIAQRRREHDFALFRQRVDIKWRV